MCSKEEISLKLFWEYIQVVDWSGSFPLKFELALIHFWALEQKQLFSVQSDRGIYNLYILSNVGAKKTILHFLKPVCFQLLLFFWCCIPKAALLNILCARIPVRPTFKTRESLSIQNPVGFHPWLSSISQQAKQKSDDHRALLWDVWLVEAP